MVKSHDLINKEGCGPDISSWTMEVDTEKEFILVSTSCMLGDAVFLHYPGIMDSYFTADNEIYLGNEGFNGDNIMRTWAILGTILKPDDY